jgi:hypothetical protein
MSADTLPKLMTGREVDLAFRWPRGRAVRLAKRGELPAVRLPGGDLRFDRADIEQLIQAAKIAHAEEGVKHAPRK